jgi:hypothetical protein
MCYGSPVRLYTRQRERLSSSINLDTADRAYRCSPPLTRRPTPSPHREIFHKRHGTRGVRGRSTTTTSTCVVVALDPCDHTAIAPSGTHIEGPITHATSHRTPSLPGERGTGSRAGRPTNACSRGERFWTGAVYVFLISACK